MGTTKLWEDEAAVAGSPPRGDSIHPEIQRELPEKCSCSEPPGLRQQYEVLSKGLGKNASPSFLWTDERCE
ncbi:UNVERIFIED_CONTAM: hypothetical protein HHA_449290 [Hammondia hammondi]|eukprot:XP_008881900.1 hypothetical protein HHA_449290 [Hammondia hammondi]